MVFHHRLRILTLNEARAREILELFTQVLTCGMRGASKDFYERKAGATSSASANLCQGS